MTSAAVASLIDAARERLGPKGVIDEPQAIAPWLTDWRGRWHGRSTVILSPASREEVAAVVGLAAAGGVPMVPQGGNTSMVGGATPPADGTALLLSLRRMNRIRSLSDDRAVAEAGVILDHLHDAARADGRRFPLTLSARGSCTVGGLVSTNAGGTQVLRFGTMRGLVAGVEAVMPDGSVHDGLSALKKDNRGYSIDQLLIGAEGTLGIVTAAALRLVPAALDRGVAWAGVASPAAALALLRSLQARTDRVEGFEIVPGDSLARVLAHIPDTRSPLTGRHPWHVLVEATASSAGQVDSPQLLQQLLADALNDGMIQDATIATSEAQAEAFWRLRDSISEAERAAGSSTQHDISVPVDAMPRFLVEGARAVEARFPGVRASGFGHLGDGNVHFHVRAPTDASADWLERVGPGVTRFVDDLVVAMDGSISAEHGIGQMKKDELARLGPASRLHALRAIKHALDPRGIMNPGKLID